MPECHSTLSRMTPRSFAIGVRLYVVRGAAPGSLCNLASSVEFLYIARMSAYLQCIEENCQKKISATTKAHVCPDCSGLLDVIYDFQISDPDKHKQTFQQRRLSNDPLDLSGVWRYRELL